MCDIPLLWSILQLTYQKKLVLQQFKIIIIMFCSTTLPIQNKSITGERRKQVPFSMGIENELNQCTSVFPNTCAWDQQMKEDKETVDGGT